MSEPTQDPRARFRELPEPIRLEDTTEELPASAVPEPGPQRDPNRDAALRWPL